MVELRDFIRDANQAMTVPALLTAFERAARRLDYEHFAFSRLKTWCDSKQPTTAEAAVLALNYPTRWVSHYLQRGYFTDDPVVRYARTSILPYEWRSLKVSNHRELLILREAGDAGLRHGISVPIHEPSGKVFLATLASENQPTTTPDECTRVHMLAVAFHERYCVLTASMSRQRPCVVLTPREHACLSWVACGKSSWDISRLMGLSEHTVNFHLKNAMRKLDTASRFAAAVRAVSQGLIAPP